MKSWFWSILALLALGGFGVWSYLRMKSRANRADEPVDEKADKPDDTIIKAGDRPAVQSNCIYLFGNFTVLNKDRRDVTYMFTARLREILGLTLQYSDSDGISSSRLSSLVWPDKEKDKVKNSRGVAVNHLRKILAELEGAELRYDSGRFKFIAGENVYCDYLECIKILADDTPLTGERRRRFLKIVSRGKFLKNFDEPIFDDFKRQVEIRLDSTVFNCIKEAYTESEYETVLEFCRVAFNIDPLNEPVLSYAINASMKLRQENEARSIYHKFTEEYRRTTGERFAKSFGDYCDD